jgi:hypothetical protein
MRKVLLTIAVLATMAQAGWITSVQSYNDPEVKTKKNSLDTYGQNPRMYQFDTDFMHCVIVYTEQDLGEKNAKSTAPVMQCITKK